jgi:hypothetical protein
MSTTYERIAPLLRAFTGTDINHLRKSRELLISTMFIARKALIGPVLGILLPCYDKRFDIEYTKRKKIPAGNRE